MVGDSMTVRTVLDSESDINYLSERLAKQMEPHLGANDWFTHA